MLEFITGIFSHLCCDKLQLNQSYCFSTIHNNRWRCWSALKREINETVTRWRLLCSCKLPRVYIMWVVSDKWTLICWPLAVVHHNNVGDVVWERKARSHQESLNVCDCNIVLPIDFKPAVFHFQAGRQVNSPPQVVTNGDGGGGEDTENFGQLCSPDVVYNTSYNYEDLLWHKSPHATTLSISRRSSVEPTCAQRMCLVSCDDWWDVYIWKSH